MKDNWSAYSRSRLTFLFLDSQFFLGSNFKISARVLFYFFVCSVSSLVNRYFANLDLFLLPSMYFIIFGLRQLRFLSCCHHRCFSSLRNAKDNLKEQRKRGAIVTLAVTIERCKRDISSVGRNYK